MTDTMPPIVRDYIFDLDDAAHERLMTRTLMPADLFDEADPLGKGCLVGLARGAGDAFVAGGFGREFKQWGWRCGRALLMDLATGVQLAFDRWYCFEGGETTQQEIRDYIVELRLKRGNTIPEPAMVDVGVGAAE